MEARDPISRALQYTIFYKFTDDNTVFFGQLLKTETDVAAEELANALEPVSDHIIFPPVFDKLTISFYHVGDEHSIKRPNIDI
jgi:hypothetical protein